MIKNYLKIALRSIKKHKGYSFINIFGFAIGLTCCLLITLFLLDEMSYDRFYPNADRIFRMAHHGVLNDRIDNSARSSPPLAKALAEEFPEVEAVVKCRNYGFPVFRYNDKIFSEEKVFSVDETFFDVFQVTALSGELKTALDQPNSLVITRSMATKYFGDEDPMGKIINADNRRDYIVTAVIEDVPPNSHFHYDFLRSLKNYQDAKSPIWVFNDFYTYVLLKPGTDLKSLEDKLFALVKERIDPFLRGVIGMSADQFIEGGGDFRYYFQPITDIHLRSNLDFELEPNGDILYVYIFLTIAIGILVIACINFVNLATARSALRMREVGIRKTIGSTQIQIMRQFLVETIIMTILSVSFTWIITSMILPFFNHISGKNLTLPLFTQWWLIPMFLGFAVLIGLAAGFYPAIFLASYKPVDVLKGDKSHGKGRSILRKNLVVFQFAISIILIVATITVHQQMNYIQNSNLGFNKDQIVVIHKTDDLGTNQLSFKEELAKYPGVLFASSSQDLFGQPIEVAALTPENGSDDEAKIICYMIVDSEFLNTYGITLNSGRFFQKDRTDHGFEMVLNKKAQIALGIEEPVGKILVNSLYPDNRYPILGVVEDFHFQSLRQQIQPMVFASFAKGETGRYISVRIRPENVKETLSYIETAWYKFAKGQAFEYEFFDDHFKRIYLAEERTEVIFLIFSALAIAIACLGLFGLSAFMTERRIKEVGVRKVLGSSTGSIVLLLIGQFLKWVLIANLIAWPIAWYMMNAWLENFVYRINIFWWIFPLAGCIAILLSMATVIYQSMKAAFTNPVNVLRYE